MDVGTLVPDSMVSRVLDGLGAIMLIVMKSAHSRFEKKMDDLQVMQTDHEVLKVTVAGMEKTLDEIKSDGKETRSDIKALLARHP